MAIQSVEPNIADLANGWMKSYKLDYKLEQESLNNEIDTALNNYHSKSGGKGGNRPDAKLLLKDKYNNYYPILIEYKGYKDKLVRLEYWTAFNDYAFDGSHPTFSREFKKRKPGKDHWMSMSIGTSACHISVLRLQQDESIGVELAIDGKTQAENKVLYNKLFAHKNDIESDIGFALDWRELPEKKASRILVLKNVNLTDQNEWPQQFDWITDTMVKMKKAFKNSYSNRAIVNIIRA